MKIGIDASRAFAKNRTGIEEYSYQVIKHLMNKLERHQVILYTRKNFKFEILNFKFPDNWRIRIIKWPYLWTQVGLSLELLFHPVDVLFIPAHVVPCVHPKNTIVTIHGLEFEFCPKAYSWRARLYMRWSIKKSCKWAKKIIAVSENTKKDLMKLYKVLEDKIEVIYEGVNSNFQFPISNFQTNPNEQISKPYLLFVGRLEERKNILGIIEAYKILKEKYNVQHKLVLAGKPGHGYKNLKFSNDIIETGYINEEEKSKLLKNAEVFLFPTFYEGFGLPILEAQSVGLPVVASNNSSIPEVAGNSALLVNPKDPSAIAESAYKLISDKDLRKDIINRGYENVKRFDWNNCAEEIAKALKF